MKKILVVLALLLVLTSGVVMAKKENSRLIPIPIVFSSPETGFGFGGMGTYFKDKGKQNLTVNSGGFYTSKGQTNLFVETTKNYSTKNYSLVLGYQDWVSKFYGIGYESRIEPPKTYNSQGFSIGGEFSQKVVSNNFVGVNLKYQDYNLDLDQKIEQNIYGSNGYNLFELGVNYTYDTRDRTMNTRNGQYFKYNIAAYNENFSDYKYNSNTFDYRIFKELYPDHVIALQTKLELRNGTVPFKELSSLGNRNLMRGIISGEFIEKNKFATQFEYRYPIYKKVSGILFASLGEVYDDFDIDRLKKTWGLGIRYNLDEERGFNLRFDFAFNAAEQKFYTHIGEAF